MFNIAGPKNTRTCIQPAMHMIIEIPPEDFIGADKLFAEARLGSINGPLKLGARRTSRVLLSPDN